jgi:hypothetical protein
MDALCRAFRVIYQVAAIATAPLILELNLRRTATILSNRYPRFLRFES